jgi:hypothetical protein
MLELFTWILLGCLSMSVAAAAERAPDLTLTGTIKGADNGAYRDVPFEMPAGVVRMTVVFSYTGRDEKTALDLGLRDPVRWRGWSGGDKSRYVLEEADGTPSYLPGPLPPGTWNLVVAVPNIRATSSADFTAKVWFERADVPFPGFLTAPINPNPGWYRGDLHMHTAHSDGACKSAKGIRVPCPVFKTLQAAQTRHLDFIAVTDHNTTTQNNSLRELAPYFDDLLLIPGREITTYKGHANVFGPTGFLDFELGTAHAPALQAIVDEVRAAHGLISINHPGAPSGEVCMGCGWLITDVAHSKVDAIEAVNGGSLNHSGSPVGQYSSIPFWEERLNSGVRITAIGGSDNHNADSAPGMPSSVGVPTTVVHASELSQAAILEGIQKGHVFVDIWGSPAGLLEVQAEAGGQHAEMGDALAVSSKAHVRLLVHVAGVPADAVVVWAGDGTKLMTAGMKPAAAQHAGNAGQEALVRQAGKESGDPSSAASARQESADPVGPLARPQQGSDVPGGSSGDVHRTFDLIADGKRHWLRADVRGADGKLLLLGNPIYLLGK